MSNIHDIFKAAGAGLNKFGRNTDVDTVAEEDIWDGGGSWAAPTTARVHNIASSDVNDTAAGTGARTVSISGLDSNGLLQGETVTLNGTSDVATTLSYTMIHRMVVLTAGSGGKNAGTISATAVTDATITAQISIGMNQTLMAIYQVPANQTLYLTGYYASMQRSVTSGAINIFLKFKPNGQVFQTKHVLGAVGAGTSHVSQAFNPALIAKPLTIVKISADVSANNTDITAGFDGILKG